MFVGRVSYNIRYLLWNPVVHHRFNRGFRRSVVTMLMCQRKAESPLALLGDDCLFYIFNMCGPDWFPDEPEPMNTPAQALKVGMAKLRGGLKATLENAMFYESRAFIFAMVILLLSLHMSQR